MSLAQRSWNHLCWVHRPGQDIIHFNGETEGEAERERFVFFSGSKLVRPNTAVAADTTFSRRSEVVDSALILGQTPASSKIRDGFSIRKMFQGNLSPGAWRVDLMTVTVPRISV